MLDRLLDLLLIAVLRTWFARPEAEAPGWYRASADPIVGPALKALHGDPAHQWTVEELARGAGVSRAALARRFNDLVGEPPMAFLTGWRIALAADLLLEPDATVGSVAARVGYGSPFALSTAFKRLRGMSPKQYRLAGGAWRSRGGRLGLRLCRRVAPSRGCVWSPSPSRGSRSPRPRGGAARASARRRATPCTAAVTTRGWPSSSRPTPDEALAEPDFPCRKHRSTEQLSPCTFGARHPTATSR